uniref:hypothetical protein n=1 Tax=Candidatus Cryptobacteroides bacterium TaxID=3085639 RepID=UPI004029504B
MERIVFQKLVERKNSTIRKPLILNGARQVGCHYQRGAGAEAERHPQYLQLWFKKDDITISNIYKIAEGYGWEVNITFKLKKVRHYHLV